VALDPEVACPACRRFWHGPAGYIPHWYGVKGYEKGGDCADPRHAAPAKRKEDDPLLVLLREAYDLGFRTDEYATGKFSEYFTYKTGDAHRDMMGMSLAAERLVALKTNRRWLNENQTGTLDKGADVDGLSVRWRERPDAELIVHPPKPGKPLPVLPIVFVTGPRIEDLTIRGWIYPHEICQDVHWNTQLPWPAWSMTQFNLHGMESLPPWSG
jgi:hypothetical protein